MDINRPFVLPNSPQGVKQGKTMVKHNRADDYYKYRI